MWDKTLKNPFPEIISDYVYYKNYVKKEKKTHLSRFLVAYSIKTRPKDSFCNKHQNIERKRE